LVYNGRVFPSGKMNLMEKKAEMYALELHQCTPITCGDTVIYAAAGDLVVDSTEGRKVMRKRDFDALVEEGGYELSGNLGDGWVCCRQPD
jgi:hypothetical protein